MIDPKNMTIHQLEKYIHFAQKAAGGKQFGDQVHNFKFLQMPFNL